MPPYWLPNPRFPAGYREKVESLAAARGQSVGSMIVNVVLEHVDAALDHDAPPNGQALKWERACVHPVAAPTRLLASGARVCWCGAVVEGQEK